MFHVSLLKKAIRDYTTTATLPNDMEEDTVVELEKILAI